MMKRHGERNSGFYLTLFIYDSNPLGSGVARICCEEGQRLKLWHGALTVDVEAWYSSCSMTNSFVTNAVLIERTVSC